MTAALISLSKQYSNCFSEIKNNSTTCLISSITPRLMFLSEMTIWKLLVRSNTMQTTAA